jgi:hypothetical protein
MGAPLTVSTNTKSFTYRFYANATPLRERQERCGGSKFILVIEIISKRGMASRKKEDLQIARLLAVQLAK